VAGRTTGPDIDEVIEQDSPKQNAKTFFGYSVDPAPDNGFGFATSAACSQNLNI
jgi:hypothetical protein